jgi:hypothetical protein
MEKN